MPRKSLLEEESGQALAEFAIIAPVFILLLCLTVDLGWAVLNKMSLDAASNTMARTQDTAGVDNTVLNKYPILEKSRVVVNAVYKYEEKNYDAHVINGGAVEDIPMVYAYRDLEVKLKYKVKSITPMGAVIFGGDGLDIESASFGQIPEATRKK